MLSILYKLFFVLSLISASLFAKDFTVAFAQDTMANDFRKNQVLETQKAFEKYKNINFIYTDAKTKTSLLIYQIENFIKQKVDLIMIGTTDEKALNQTLEKIALANIPVIIVDRGVDSKTYTTFINSDNIKIGNIAAEFLVKKLNGKGTILLLEGLQTADVTHLRTKGFTDIVSNYPNIQVIKVTANYLRRDAIIEVEKLLKDGIHFDAIFSESDSMLSGARSAMLKYGIDLKKVLSIGCDYTSEARREILAGNQTGSVKFPLAGYESADVAIKILNHEKVPKHIVIPVKLVTKENATEVEPIFEINFKCKNKY